MSDYKYIKFTDLTSAVGQTEQSVAIRGLRNNNFDGDFGLLRFTYLLADAGSNQVEIAVVGPDGSTPFTGGGAPGYTSADYVAFCNAIVDFIFDAMQSGKTLTEVKCGLGGTIRQDLGVITSLTFA